MKKNWYKGLTATAISLAMAGAAVSVPAFAVDYDLSYGDVTVDGNLSWQENNPDGWISTNPYDHSTQTVTDSQGNEVLDTNVNIIQKDTTVATDNTVTITGDLTCGTEDTSDDIKVNIDGVNVDTDDTFLTIGNNANVDVTISDSQIKTGADEIRDWTAEDEGQIPGSDAIKIGNNADVDLTIADSTIESDKSIISIGKDQTLTSNPTDGSDVTLNLIGNNEGNEFTSLNGITSENSNLTLNFDGSNTFNGLSNLEDATASWYSGNALPAYEHSGIYIRNGGTVDINGADADASLTFTGFQNGIATDSLADAKIDVSTGTVTLTESVHDAKGSDGYGMDNGTTGNGIYVGDGYSPYGYAGRNGNNGMDYALGQFSLTVDGNKVDGVYDTHFVIEKNQGGGIVFYNTDTATDKPVSTVTVKDAEFSSSYNGGVGLYIDKPATVVTYAFDNSLVHINYNGSNGFTGQGNTKLYVSNGTTMNVDNNKGVGVNNTNTVVEDSYFSVSGNGSHGWSNGYFDIFNSVADFNNNAYRGLNVTAASSDYTNSQVINSVITANYNGYTGKSDIWGGGIYFGVGANVDGSSITANNNGLHGIWFGGSGKVNSSVIKDSTVTALNNSVSYEDASEYVSTSGSHTYRDTAYNSDIVVRSSLDVIDSVVTAKGSEIALNLYNGSSSKEATMTVQGASVIALDGISWDIWDDWNSKGYTGREIVTSGSLQGELDKMYGYFLVNLSKEELAEMSDLDLFLYICKQYNEGNGINAIVTARPDPNAPDSEYAGPVNEDGTLLFRFDLNGEVAHGYALKDNGDGTYTFTYTDPNTLNVYEYTFRYNTDEEDLNGEGNNAYVWAPVTIIHYNPTNNKLNDADLGTATKDTEEGNTASDYTIFGTTINLAEKDMPSYASPDPVVTVKKEYRDGRIYTTTTTTTSTYGWWVCVEDGKIVDISDKVPGEGATEEEWQAFYDLLNTYVDEETDLLALCGGDTALAEEITVYGMWTTKSEEAITSEPIEFPPYEPDPKPDPKPVEPEVPDVPDIPEEPTPVEPEEPVTPSIPDEVIDDIIDEVEQLIKVPQTGAEEEADDYAAAAVPAGVLALAVAGLLKRKRRAE